MLCFKYDIFYHLSPLTLTCSTLFIMYFYSNKNDHYEKNILLEMCHAAGLCIGNGRSAMGLTIFFKNAKLRDEAVPQLFL